MPEDRFWQDSFWKGGSAMAITFCQTCEAAFVWLPLDPNKRDEGLEEVANV